MVAEFLHLNLIPIEWVEDCEGNSYITPPRAPTTEEIDTILRPFRCDPLRWHAENLYRDELCPVLLRTHYSTDEDERAQHDEEMKKWTDGDTFCDESWWAVLDNATLFNFGPDWHRIYNILPEVAYPIQFECLTGSDTKFKRYFEPSYHEEMRSYFKRDLATMKHDDPGAWHNDRFAVIERAAISLQRSATSTYIIIADEEAFRSGGLRVLYLDAFRRIVREGRIDPEADDVSSIVGSWMETSGLMEYSTVGERYRVNGDLGRELYQLTEENLADP